MYSWTVTTDRKSEHADTTHKFGAPEKHHPTLLRYDRFGELAMIGNARLRSIRRLLNVKQKREATG
jgi:hypothetical protein